MKYGVLLIETGVPEDDSPEALRHYVDVVLGTGLYADKLGFVQSRLFRHVTIPAKRRDWRRYFYGDGTDVASTYLRHAKSLRDKLAGRLAEATRRQGIVTVGMRCGSPSLDEAANTLMQEGCSTIVLLPLYPLRFPPMTGPALDEARAAIERVGKGAWTPQVIEIDSFCRTPGFAQTLATRIGRDWKPRNVSRLLILMPSEPRSLARDDGTYGEQVEWLRDRLCKSLKLGGDHVHVAFVGDHDNSEWLGPFAEKTLLGWAAGVRDVRAVCPAFCSADALGSHDAGSRLKAFFEANVAGKPPTYEFVPPLGDDDELADILCNTIVKKL